MNYKFFHKFNKNIVPLLISAFFLTSCISYKIVNKNKMTFIENYKEKRILAGDEIKVTKSDGQIFILKYIDITNEILIAETQERKAGFRRDRELRIPLDQITKIEKREFDGSKTAKYTARLIIGVSVVLIFGILASVLVLIINP